MTASPDNSTLAQCCMDNEAECCKKGKIFLPPQDYEAILNWIRTQSPQDEATFLSQIETYEGFYLFNQQTRCQFLDHRNLCLLHEPGVKPKECFWWPLHVYADDEQTLSIRSASYCCAAADCIQPDSPHVDTVTQQAAEIGNQLIHRYRKVYPGLARDKKFVRRLPAT